LTKLIRLPNVTGYIVAGVLIGPFVLDLVPQDLILGMSFLSNIALSFIAFGIGKFFKKDVIKKGGPKVLVISLSETLLAGVLVTLATKFIFGLQWDFALLLGAIATATAPASTMQTINQYKAKGEFVDTLLQVVAIDNVICLLLFTVAIAIVQGNYGSGGTQVMDVIWPLIFNIIFIAVGFLFGVILSYLIKGRGESNRLIILVAMLFLLTGAGSLLGVSPLLSCMAFGASYINFTKDDELFKQLNSFTPPIMLLFFVLSGLRMDLSAFLSIGLIGIVYFAMRFVGKYFGVFGGASIVKSEKTTRNYLGLGLIPQAGVAIALAFMGQQALKGTADADGKDLGVLFMNIVLVASLLYEMVGPVLAKFAIFRSGNVPDYTPKRLRGEKPVADVELIPMSHSEGDEDEDNIVIPQ
ncbi:MAG: cation:proton antiporter, partial [Bacilli bacterium]|nr:cation:proton antiporter [Bacilli bacterium]